MSALDPLLGGGKGRIARALADLEARPEAEATTALLDEAFARPKGIALGLTGPPGVGKSTLTDALIRGWRGAGRTVAVVAVDPSSRRSRGALLGDRTRLVTDPEDAGVFIRSMAARDRLGGVAEITFPALVLLRALYDLVIVETVGVGQSETEIAEISDSVILCVQPGSGDGLQHMKAGIMEIPDLVLVTKSDLGALARRAVTDLKGALSLAAGRGEAPPVMGISAATGEGIAPVIDWIASRPTALHSARAAAASHWLDRQLALRFGEEGAATLPGDLARAAAVRPFAACRTASTRLRQALATAFG